MTLGVGVLVACRNKAKHGMASVVRVSGSIPEPVAARLHPPDLNSIVYWVRKALDAHYADDDGSALRKPMDELQKLIDMLPK